MPTVQTQSGLAGQYGYANGAPILNASVARNLLGNEFYKPLDIERNDLGWGTNSRYQGAIRTGVGLYGIQGNRDEILQLLDIGERAKQDFAAGRIIATQDPETGEARYAELVDTGEGPQYSIPAAYQRFAIGGEEGSNPMQNFARWQDITSTLQNAAQSLGIPITGLTDRQLFDAINAVDTRVAVTGRTQFWDPAQAGIGGQQGPQHATVVYAEQDGRLVPVSTPQTFTFQDPNTTRGVLGDLASFVRDVISLPPISAALAAYIGPQLASYLTATYGLSPTVATTLANSSLNAAIQTAATGDVEAGLQSGLLSAAGSAMSNAFNGTGQAGGTGLTVGAGGETGLLSGAGGVTGLTAPPGFTFAPDIGSTLPSVVSTTQPNLLDTAQFETTLPEMGGGTGITPTAAGEGFQVQETPNIRSMGGGQGLTVPVEGGTISQLGFTPTGATPVLGDPSSFINNPEVLGQPVIQQGSPTSSISPRDALRAANALRQLTQQPEQQAPQTPEQTGQSGPLGVDYSQLLNLLANQARTTGLLGTRFQPTPVNLSSLLG
jgi:hypothetical protein